MKAIKYKGQRVITTEMLAQVYETDTNNIGKNFNRNKDKFIENLHYFLLEGEELKRVKGEGLLVGNLKYAPQLYLWTERGANRHSKILDTDKAWEQFENLEETYFRVKESPILTSAPTDIKYLNGLANYIRIQRTVMLDNGCSPYEVAIMDKMTCEAYHIPIPECLAKENPFEQLAIQQMAERKLIE